MKTLITLLSIGEKYSNSCKLLIDQLLQNTPYDILISTDDISFFPIYPERVTVRNNMEDGILLNYYTEFNYNLKFHAFKDLPEGYEIVLYLDCDIKNNFWDQKSTELIENILSNYDFVGTRFNCVLKNEIDQLAKTGNCLFKHKIDSYQVLKWEDTSLLEAKLPSEHFFGFKYDKVKLNLFYEKWRELNFLLQKDPVDNRSWGDGFEIGIAAFHAGYTNVYDLEFGRQLTVLGLEFNGNKL